MLQARLAGVDRRLAAGTVSVVRGGKALLRKRAQPGRRRADRGAVAAGVGVGPAVPDRRRGEGQGVGQRDDPLEPRPGLAGDQTARPARSPGEPAARPLPAVAPGRFAYRGEEVAAQAATGAVRYDISCDPARGRWYLDASWKAAPAPAAPLDGLRQHPVLAVDLNDGHLAAWAVTPDGNPAGPPVTVPVDLAGLPAASVTGGSAPPSLADQARPPARLPGDRDRGPGLR